MCFKTFHFLHTSHLETFIYLHIALFQMLCCCEVELHTTLPQFFQDNFVLPFGCLEFTHFGQQLFNFH